MNDEQIRITALTEMFLGLGHEPTPERLAYYARLTKNIPTEWFRVACDHAVVASKSGFPPSPGEIISQAERLHREKIIADGAARARKEWAEHEASLHAPENAEAIAELINLSLRKAGA